jgi:hypothetical protein
MKDDRRRRRKPRAVLLPDTNPRRFVVTRRPRLSKLTDYPELDFADYERRLASLQGVLQLVQQAYKSVPEHEIPKTLSRLQFVRFDTGRGITRPLAELAEALRQDLDWIREHTRLGELARRWEGRTRPESLLLRGDDLDAAKAWMATRKVGAPEITDAQRALITASEEAEAKRLGNERAQLEREKAQLAEIKGAQARTARMQRITRWAFAAVAAVILIAGGIVGWLQADEAQKLAALNESLNRRQVALDHAQANILAELSAAKLSRREFDSALRLALRGTRIDLALPSDAVKASSAAAALAAGVAEANWRFVLVGHTDLVTSAAFRPDGSRIVTASWDKTARIWDAATATEIAVLRGHESWVDSAAFSPDGSRIVTAALASFRKFDDSFGYAVVGIKIAPVSLNSRASHFECIVHGPRGFRVKLFAAEKWCD